MKKLIYVALMLLSINVFANDDCTTQGCSQFPSNDTHNLNQSDVNSNSVVNSVGWSHPISMGGNNVPVPTSAITINGAECA